MPVQRTRFSQNAYLAITDYLLNELNSRFSLDATAVMEGIQSLNPRSKAFLDMTTLQEMPLKYDKHVSSDDLVHEVPPAKRLLDRKAEEGVDVDTLQQLNLRSPTRTHFTRCFGS